MMFAVSYSHRMSRNTSLVPKGTWHHPNTTWDPVVVTAVEAFDGI